VKSNSISTGIKKITSINEFALFAILVVIGIILTVTTEYFFTVRNLSNILGQVSMAAIAGCGMVLVVLTGEVDVSIGSLQAFVALPLIFVLNLTTNLAVAVLAAMVVGGIIGCINGFLVAKLKINSLIATLGMYYMLRGLVYVITGNRAMDETSGKEIFFLLGNGKLFRVIPYSAIIMAVILLVFGYILKNTRHGRNIYAVGGNSEVAKFIGINPARVKFISFVLSSVLSTIAAVILASRLGSANHMAGIGFEFKVVAATVLGGVSLAGGRGSLLGAFIGVLILGVLQNGMGMLGFNIMWEQISTGIIIILSVTIDELKRSKG
jgi:ribose/xylose/arabinose/galactoside ABC-type transport system permease subunit